MEIHGILWKSMEIHGIPRNIHGVSMEYPWSSMEYHGVPWSIGVRAGEARGAAAPPNFGQLNFFGQQEKIWAKPDFEDLNINLKSA